MEHDKDGAKPEQSFQQNADGKQGNRERMNLDDVVWAPCPRDGYKTAKIKDIGATDITVKFSDGSPGVFGYDDIYPTEKDLKRTVDDNCALMYLNVANLLNNSKERYINDKFYTYVANILVAINPYKNIKGFYDAATIKAYKGKSLGTLPPHCFAIADKSYRDMKVFNQSQSVIVSGESGAGKTENTKFMINYLVHNYGSGQSSLDAKIIEANPLLEAFGNAKTVRNNNSSRFGKFIEVHFNEKHAVDGAQFSHYLLERSRIVSQNKNERNYHIFYRLCAGAPADVKGALKLQAPEAYHYLNQGDTRLFGSQLKDPMLNDKGDFVRTENAMKKIGMAKDKRMDVFKIVAAVLHLGNVEIIDGSNGGAEVTPKGIPAINAAAELLGMDATQLIESITTRATKIPGEATLVKKALIARNAIHARDALAKALYAKLFDYVCELINKSIPAGGSSFIGILDIAGFEYFENNSFEQFCINYCNEKLQQFFNKRTLKDEMELYKTEGLKTKGVEYIDNQDMIELIEKPRVGIIDVLDEEMKLPKPLDSHFAETLYNNHRKNGRFLSPRKSPVTKYKALTDSEAFILRHFAGAVCYNVNGFVDKNTDGLHDSLLQLCATAKHSILVKMFAADAKRKTGRGKLQLKSNGSTFRTNLNILMEKLNSTGSSFIRCIKPNEKMAPQEFNGASIMSQLHSAGIPAVLELMQAGYPSRTHFSDLYGMYKKHMPAKLSKLDPKLFTRALFQALGLNTNDFTYGVSKVFFKPGKFAAFDQMMNGDPEHLREMLKKVEQWLIKARWRYYIHGVWMAIKLEKKIEYRRAAATTIQAYWRGWLVRRRQKLVLELYRRSKNLVARSDELIQAASKVPKGKARDDMLKQVQNYQSQLSAAQLATKKLALEKNPQTSPQLKKIDQNIQALLAQEGKLMKSIASLSKAEQERLRKLEEERRRKEEEERQRKLEEEERRRKEEEERKMRAEMEKQRKIEEARQKDEEQKMQKIQAQMEAEMARTAAEESAKRQREEQERRDRELASRLQMEQDEDASQVGLSTAPTRQKNIAKNEKGQRYDLTKWNYAQLRDFINTSSDVEMIKSCREEFARRLQAYHKWKDQNKASGQSTGTQSEARMPDNVRAMAEQAVSQTGSAPATVNKKQRYFKVPFNPRQGGAKLGWWYAHFDGNYVKRQMELHPNKEPILLIRGRHDLEMCELSLEKTGLTGRKGAEIFPHIFDEMWERCGGKLITDWKPPPRRKQN